MHVAIITTSYPDVVPGSEAAGSFVADFAQQLGEQVKVTVIAAASAASRSRDGDVDVIRFAVPRLPVSLLRPLHPSDWLAIAKTLRSGKQTMQQFVHDSSPSFIFALWALPAGHWAAQAARQYDIPFAIWALGSDIWSLGRVPLLRWKLQRVLRAANHCFADGFQLAEDVERLSGRRCRFLASARVLPQPDDNGTAPAAPYKLAFLGRWHRNKGADLLLDALRQLSDRDWSRIAAVRICGGGPLHDDVQHVVTELQGQHRPVEMGGYLDKQGAANLIAWADFLLLPSRIESIPVIFSDAVQLRTPIIATPVGDLPVLHDKYNFGILATAANSEAFAQALRNALDSDATKYQVGLELAAADFELSGIARRFIAEIRQSGA
ncbi:MAG: glycosyltransferase [Proteobacteria bacterium]|nr:glycosyltransferase [Pseudomonadota bacterium]